MSFCDSFLDSFGHNLCLDFGNRCGFSFLFAWHDLVTFSF